MTVERDLTEHAKLLEDSAAKARSIDDSDPSLKSLLEQFLQNSLQSANLPEQFRLFKLEGGMQFLVGVQFIDQVPHVWYGDLAQRRATDWIKKAIEESFARYQSEASLGKNFHDVFEFIKDRKLLATNTNLGAGAIPIVKNPLEDSFALMQAEMHKFRPGLQEKAAPVKKKSVSPVRKLLAGFGLFREREKPTNEQQVLPSNLTQNKKQ